MISIKDFEKNFKKYVNLFLSRGYSKKSSQKLFDSYQKYKLYLNKWELLKKNINLLSKKYFQLTDKEKQILILDKKKIKKITEDLTLARDLFFDLWIRVPNVPRETSPITKKNCKYIVVSETNNLEKKINVIHHENFLINNQWIETKNVNTIYGSRFIVFKNFGAKLRQGLINFLITKNIKNNFEFYSFPFLINEVGLTNSGQLPKFKNNLFKTSLNKYLSPTGEVQILNLFVHTLFDKNFETKKICTYTECFRKEAGAAGKDTKGLIRLHQFGKLETFLLTKNDDNIEENLSWLLKNATNLLDDLELPYRVIELTRKELGISAAKTYDIEVWMPSQKKYIEIASCSLCTDYQARRSNIKYLDANGKKLYVNTYNCSALPIERLMAAIIENHQKDEKNILFPKSLTPFIF